MLQRCAGPRTGQAPMTCRLRLTMHTLLAHQVCNDHGKFTYLPLGLLRSAPAQGHVCRVSRSAPCAA